MIRRIFISIVLILGFLLSGIFALVLSAQLRKEPKQVVREKLCVVVDTREVKRQDYREEITAYGVARALRQTQIQAQISGIVAKISPKLEAGSLVDTRDELVTIDDGDLQKVLSIAKTELSQAREQVAVIETEIAGIKEQIPLARKEMQAYRQNLQKYQDLQKKSDVTLLRLNDEIAQSALRERFFLQLQWQAKKKIVEMRQAQNAVILQETKVQQAQDQVAKAKIFAPFAGIIGERYVHLGTRVTPGTMLFSVVDPHRIEIPIAIPASHFGTIAVGSEVEIHQQDSSFVAQVRRVAAEIHPQRRTFPAYVEVDGKTIAPGAFVSCRVQGKLHRGIFVLSRQAFFGEKIFVAEKSEEGYIARARIPHVYKFLPDVALLKEGLTAGEQVIVTRVDEIADGTSIEIIEEKAR